MSSKFNWSGVSNLDSKSYICGYCGNPLASNQGYYTTNRSPEGEYGKIYICHYCTAPTYFIEPVNFQVPGPSFGEPVKYLPKEIESLYNEARGCLSVNATTASILCSRKLLMNIAVSKGAKEGLTFIDYVNFISDKGFVPPDGKDWVDHIRSKGNEATHEINIMSREDAEELITFLEMLLKFIYEFPEAIKSKKK